MTIEEFIEARIAEDEAIAKAATAGDWEWSDGGTLGVLSDWRSCEYYCQFPPDAKGSRGMPQKPHQHEHRYSDELVISAVGYDDPEVQVSDQDAVHIARHDPARVLRQCKALRVLVESAGGCSWCDTFGEDQNATLKTTAAIWSDHPDYRAEWAA